MKTGLSLLFLLPLHAAAEAFTYTPFSVYDEGDVTMRACLNTISLSASFCAPTKEDRKGFGCMCLNDNARATMMGCVAELHGEVYTEASKWFTKFCDTTPGDYSEAALMLALDNYKQNAQPAPEGSPNKSTKRANGRPTTAVVDYPVTVNATLAANYHLAFEQFYYNFNYAYFFSDALYGYWALVFVLAAGCNWGVVIFPGIRNACNGRWSKMWRKYITLPALVRKKRTNHQKFLGLLNFLIPSRLETIIGSIFFWLLFIFNAVKIDYSTGNPRFPTRYAAVLRLVADRTAVMGTMLLPLLFLIGGRNNFLQWFTRWKFSTFIMYHRWIGRAIVALILIHSINYSVIEMNAGYPTFVQEEYIIYGLIATVAGCVICMQGLLFLRRAFYEVFLVIHILMAVCFLMGAWRHISSFKFMAWVFACVAVWSVDRLVRIIRMVWFGAPKATITLLSQECLRVTVPKPSHWKSVPGGHAWVYFCHSWYFWQSHPFTFLDSTVEENQIVFILKAKRGATHYLTKVLANRPGKSCTMRVVVEGPYGEACPVEHHDSAVFVAGGNGIPGIFSEVYGLSRRSVNNEKQRLKLHWILRDMLTIEWVWEELSALRQTKIEATIYITRPEVSAAAVLYERINSVDMNSSQEKEKDSDTKEKGDLLEMLRAHFPHVAIKTGRPTVDQIVDQEVEEAQSSAAFITCGHPIMVDDLRYAVVLKIDKTDKRVDFYEQLQVWA